MVIKIQPKADQIVKVLFENFCECCELGEEGCIQAETKTPCSVFWTIQFLCPDKPFVNRIMGRYMTCPNCQNIGMVPPGSAFDAPIQPILVCESCHSPLWRGQYGVLVDKIEDINKSFAIRIVDEDGVLKVRSVDEDNRLERLYGSDEEVTW